MIPIGGLKTQPSIHIQQLNYEPSILGGICIVAVMLMPPGSPCSQTSCRGLRTIVQPQSVSGSSKRKSVARHGVATNWGP